MTILVTGSAGFIGFHVSRNLLEQGKNIIGIDNLNSYYDTGLKNARLAILQSYSNFTFINHNIAEQINIKEDVNHIIHLAAQAGVRYSLENPESYIRSNLIGHFNMLEYCRSLKNLKHFVYASSSSVYGGNTNLPFAIEDKVDAPRSLYAATKKADELMTYSYSHLFKIPSTGLRFFTVYGEWGRPDMATWLFTENIINGKPITVYNNGDMKRDFTYIDDIVSGILAVTGKPPQGDLPYKIYNLGNNNSENLMDFIKVLEDSIGRKAIIEFKPMHPGDVLETYADIAESVRDFGFAPKTSIEEGLPKFVAWYKKYYSMA